MLIDSEKLKQSVKGLMSEGDDIVTKATNLGLKACIELIEINEWATQEEQRQSFKGGKG